MTTERSTTMEAAMTRLLTSAPPNLAPACPGRGRPGRPLRADGFADRPAGRGLERARRVRPSRPPPTTRRSRRTHQARTGRPAYRRRHAAASSRERDRRRLAGDRRVRIDLDLRGHTDFERDVWHKALEIPRGEVRPYGWVAAEIGRPEGGPRGRHGARATTRCRSSFPATAWSGRDGTIGQYSLGGPGNKRTILAAEGLDPTRWSGGPRGRPLHRLGHDQVVCMPTCRHARRVTDRHRWRSARCGAGRRRLPCLPRVPAGLGLPSPPERSDRGLRRNLPPPYTAVTLDQPAMPTAPATDRHLAIRDLAGMLDPVRGLGLDLPRDRDRGRDDPAVHHGRHAVLIAGVILLAWSFARDGGFASRPAAQWRDSAIVGSLLSAAGWGWSPSVSRPCRPGSPPCSSR